jgi:transposase
MTRSRKDFKARRIDWGNEKELIGDGPGYLLFCREDVLDLRTGSATKSAPELKKILKGFQALDAKTGEIYWLAYDLSRIYGGDNFGGFNESKNNVLEAISQIMTAEKGELQDQGVCDFLARHPKVRIHYTPTNSSWLNQVEIWFSKIQRDLIARGIFCSVKDLDRKIMRYIRSYNRKATPIKWSYKDASNRIKTALESTETVH